MTRPGPPGGGFLDIKATDEYDRDHHARRIRRGGPRGQFAPALLVLLGFVLIGAGSALSFEPLQWLGGLILIVGVASVLLIRNR